MKIVDIISIAIGLVGLAFAFYSNGQLTKGVKIGALRHIRTLINRMEEEKHKQPKDSVAWATMHHSQQELDATFRSLQAIFSISDNDAPLT